MSTAVIGATGRTGSETVRGLLAAGQSVIALVRDPGKAERLFGDAPGLEVRDVSLDDPRAVTAGLAGAETLFIAMGAVGLEGALQRIALTAAAAAPDIAQVVRLAVLNTSAESLGINQRGHWSIDQTARAAGVGYATLRPAIYSASMLAAGHEVKAARTWTGLADSGRVALIDHRDVAEVAVRVLRDRELWNRHYDLTGPKQLSWPEALELLSAELGETVLFQVATERALIERIVGAGLPPGQAELLIAREWAILAGENERTTTTVRELTGHEPHSVEAFLHEFREAFA
jgi:NAD(P)H dehydrogenase (quinone)